ncbi:hypothetical protein [Porphyromonas gulae]|uniref:hypothetical protein n=1 Tax=Porphyromonas gulae TaxID=111105 RepID=UPI0026F238FB|nr:hypothetical protein [Porphyromonas gulae]
MKRTLLLLVVLLYGIAAPLAAQDVIRPWSLQAGAGYSDTQNIPGGFTYGFYLGKRMGSFLEVGLSMYNSTRQTANNADSYASNDTDGSFQVNISSPNEKWSFFDAGSANCYMVVVGVNPLQLFWQNSPHNLLLAAQAGLSNKHNIHFIYGDKGAKVNIYTNSNTYIGYGARVSYEYRILKSVGAGAAMMYDHGNKMLTAMATLTTHF